MATPPLPGSTTITGRYPGRIGQTFVAIPDELYQYRAALDLDSGSMALVHALERRRWRYFKGGPVRATFKMLIADTGDSKSTLIRRIRSLETDGLLRVQRSKSAAQCNEPNRYDLTPLWDTLAALVEQDDGKRSFQNDTTPGVGMTLNEEPLTWSLKESSLSSFKASSPRTSSNSGDEMGKKNNLRLVA
jgi:DNA-binding HxlR family transcriptional regulator